MTLYNLTFSSPTNYGCLCPLTWEHCIHYFHTNPSTHLRQLISIGLQEIVSSTTRTRSTSGVSKWSVWLGKTWGRSLIDISLVSLLSYFVSFPSYNDSGVSVFFYLLGIALWNCLHLINWSLLMRINLLLSPQTLSNWFRSLSHQERRLIASKPVAQLLQSRLMSLHLVLWLNLLLIHLPKF